MLAHHPNQQAAAVQQQQQPVDEDAPRVAAVQEELRVAELVDEGPSKSWSSVMPFQQGVLV